jgi:hypothetical protein
LTTSSFSADSPLEGKVTGLAAELGNREGQFWGIACYRKGSAVEDNFCGRAVQTIARAGGLAFVGATPAPRPFGAEVKFPAGCVEESLRVRCATGEVSIMKPDGRDPEQVISETHKSLEKLAKADGASLEKSTETDCRHLGQPARCSEVAIVDAATQERVRYIFVMPGDRSLLVCSFASQGDEAALAPPCSTLLTPSN